MSWNDVLDNANLQEATGKKLVATSNKAIEEFYPELYSRSTGGQFANTSGSHLIAELLTAPHVVVDVYNAQTPDSLITKYGVDLEFLLALRDKGHITICANQLPDFYKESGWLHELLADRRTIFRSIRTPLYFESLSPGFMGSKSEREARLSAWLNNLTSSEVDTLCDLTLAAHRPNSAPVLAHVLALWITQIEATIGTEITEEIMNKLLIEPRTVMGQIGQARFLAVSPFSAGLGGYLRVPVAEMRALFPAEQLQDAFSNSELSRLDGVNEYLLRQTAGISTEDMTSEKYWHQQATRVGKDTLLALFSDKNFRTEAMRAEQTLRVAFGKMPPEEVPYDLIDGYVQHVDKQRKWVEAAIDASYCGSALALAFWGSRYVGFIGLAARAVGNPIFKSIMREVSESLTRIGSGTWL